jgi:nitroreductase
MTKTPDAAQIPTLEPLTMPIEEAMRTQRALRRLRPDPVDDALVLRLIELALKAPTSRNAQPWEFVLVKDRTVKTRLARLYRIAWGLYGRLSQRLTTTNPEDVTTAQSRAVAGGALRGDSGAGSRVSARRTAGVATAYGHQLLWVNLSLRAKSAAGGTGGRARRGVDHAAAVEYLAGTAGTRVAVARHPLCRGAAGLADGAVRADDAASRRRGRAPRLLWASAVQSLLDLNGCDLLVAPARAG